MPNLYSAQGVETEETPDNNAKDQEPEYRGPHLNFHIIDPPVQPNPYASTTTIPSFPNNVSL